MTNLHNIGQNLHGAIAGHIWEQTILPFHSGDGLVSLGNTGPVSISKQVVCIHDANVWTYPSSYSPAFRTLNRVLQPVLGRCARQIITVSRASADSLIALGIVPSHKIEIVPNGHEHVFRWDAKRSKLASKEAEATRPFVFAVGSRAAHKNIALLLSIATDIDRLGADLYISGGSFGIFSSTAVEEYSPNVKMLGYVTDDDLAFLYTNALCLAFPSFVEGFGLPLVEAMAFGCPIVCSNTSCMPEICGDYASYAAPDAPDEWVKAIDGIRRSDRQRNAPSARLSQFSWDLSSARLDELVRLLS